MADTDAVQDSFIETGVDRLVKLVKEKEKMSVPDAAKQLGVSVSTIEEWVDFLEEEGIISLEYKFATPYIVIRKLSKDEIVTKAKDFQKKKDLFIRKAEDAVNVLENQEAGLDKLKQKFESIKKEFGSEFQDVQNKLKELENFEGLKAKLDKEIADHKLLFMADIEKITKDIGKLKEKYGDIHHDIEEEEKKLSQEKSMTDSLQAAHAQLRQKALEYENVLKQIEEKEKKENSQIEETQSHIKKMIDSARAFKKEIEDKEKAIAGLVGKHKEHSEKVVALQQKIIEEFAKKKRVIGEEVAQSKKKVDAFRQFFEEKNRLGELISALNADRDILRKDFLDLQKKAKAVNLAEPSQELTQKISEIEKKFKDITERRELFQKKVQELLGFLHKE